MADIKLKSITVVPEVDPDNPHACAPTPRQIRDAEFASYLEANPPKPNKDLEEAIRVAKTILELPYLKEADEGLRILAEQFLNLIDD